MIRGLLDIYKDVKSITQMIEHALKDEHRTPYHRVGWKLKGMKKRYYGHAYWPVIKEDKKGNVVGVLRDRAYQIIDGTFYRCHVDNKDNIFIPYVNGELESNMFHNATRKERRKLEADTRKKNRRNSVAMKGLRV